MPSLSLTVNYDGTDAEIVQALSRMVAVFSATNGSGQGPAGNGAGWPEKAAGKFAGYVSATAARGKSSQQAVMQVWLKRHGVAPLEDLVKAADVAKSHDFAGVSSSLTRNMLKAGGPKKWYQEYREVNGKRMRRISDELIDPLKRAFGL